jgi:IS30 family transposase
VHPCLFDRTVEIAEMNYTHLTQDERYQIYALKKAGHTQCEIAGVLERSASTINRELSRNSGQRGYCPKQAHYLSVERCAMNARQIDEATWQFAQEELLVEWSPEQISGYLRAAGQGSISPETDLSACLCRQANGWPAVGEATLPEEAQETLWHDQPAWNHSQPALH